MARPRVFVLGLLSLALLIGGLHLAAADAPDVTKLIDQLGSMKFADREAAAKALDELGAPALDALRKAAKGEDAEARRRAADLVTKIERRLETARYLAAKTVRIDCKAKPLADVVADLAKQSGYDVRIDGDARKLAARSVTLDTGATTFWQALDQLCQKADVVDAMEPYADPRLIKQGLPATGPISILLRAAPRSATPTSFAGAVRIRTAKMGSAHLADGVVSLALEVALEPRVVLEKPISLRVGKARDDQGQTLAPIESSEPQPNQGEVFNRNGMPAYVGPSPGVTVRLAQFKSGDKPAKSLVELNGFVTLQVRSAPEALVTIDDILKAEGKNAEGKNGGKLTVVGVSKEANGQVRVQVEVEAPPGEEQPVRVGRRIRVIPAPPVMPIAPIQPVPPIAPLPVPFPQMQVQIQGGRAAGNVVFIGGNDQNTFQLTDAKGNKFALVGTGSNMRIMNNVVSVTQTLVFAPQANMGEAAALEYVGTRLVNLEVPFTLKDVPLP